MRISDALINLMRALSVKGVAESQSAYVIQRLIPRLLPFYGHKKSKECRIFLPLTNISLGPFDLTPSYIRLKP